MLIQHKNWQFRSSASQHHQGQSAPMINQERAYSWNISPVIFAQNLTNAIDCHTAVFADSEWFLLLFKKRVVRWVVVRHGVGLEAELTLSV
jgi:hypothetical protein